MPIVAVTATFRLLNVFVVIDHASRRLVWVDVTALAARGSDRKFATEAEVIEKFEKLALHVLPQTQVTEICETVLQFEKVQDAGKLARLLALP